MLETSQIPTLADCPGIRQARRIVPDPESTHRTSRPPFLQVAPTTIDVWFWVWHYAVMHKTTVYLPEHLRHAIKRVAEDRQTSEAEVIRTALEAYTADVARPRPRLGLFESHLPIVDWDEALQGFGER